ncbi:hypothetical protein ABK040_010306 [Willaertia magna]
MSSGGIFHLNYSTSNQSQTEITTEWIIKRNNLSFEQIHSPLVQFWIKQDQQQYDQNVNKIIFQSDYLNKLKDLPLEIKFEIITFIPTLTMRRHVYLLKSFISSDEQNLFYQYHQTFLQRFENTLSTIKSNKKLNYLFENSLSKVNNIDNYCYYENNDEMTFDYEKEIKFIYQEDKPIISYLKYRTICKEFKNKFERLILEMNKNCLNLFYLSGIDDFGIKYNHATERYQFIYCLFRSLKEEEKQGLKKENVTKELFDDSFIKEFKQTSVPNASIDFGTTSVFATISTQPSSFNFITPTAAEESDDEDVMNDGDSNFGNINDNNTGFSFGTTTTTANTNTTAFDFGTTTHNGFYFGDSNTSNTSGFGDSSIGTTSVFNNSTSNNNFSFGTTVATSATNIFSFNTNSTAFNNTATFGTTTSNVNNNGNNAFSFGATTNDNSSGLNFGSTNDNNNTGFSFGATTTAANNTATTTSGFAFGNPFLPTNNNTTTTAFNSDRETDINNNYVSIIIPKDVRNITKKEERELVEKLKAEKQQTIPEISISPYGYTYGSSTFSDTTKEFSIHPPQHTNSFPFTQNQDYFSLIQGNFFSLMKANQLYLNGVKKIIINCYHLVSNEITNLISLFPNVEHIVETGLTLNEFTVCLNNNFFNTELKKLEKLEILIPPSKVNNDELDNQSQMISSKLKYLKYLIIPFDIPENTNQGFAFGGTFGGTPTFEAKAIKKFIEEFKELPSQLNHTDNELYVFVEPLSALTEKRIRKIVSEYHYSPFMDKLSSTSVGSLVYKIIYNQSMDKIEQKNIITYLIKEERVPIQYTNLVLTSGYNSDSQVVDKNIFEYLIYLSKNYNYDLLIEHESKITTGFSFGAAYNGTFNKDLVLQSLIFGWKEELFQSLIENGKNDISESGMDQLLFICALDEDLFNQMISFIKSLLEKNNQIKKIFNSFQFYLLLKRLSNLGKWNCFYEVLQFDKYVINIDEIFKITILKKHLFYECFYHLFITDVSQNNLPNDSNPYLICMNELIERTPSFVDQIFTHQNDNILQFLIKLSSKQVSEAKHFGGIYILKQLLETIIERGEEKEILTHKNTLKMTALHLCCASKLNSDSLFFTKKLLKVAKEKLSEYEFKELINAKDSNQNTAIDYLNSKEKFMEPRLKKDLMKYLK